MGDFRWGQVTFTERASVTVRDRDREGTLTFRAVGCPVGCPPLLLLGSCHAYFSRVESRKGKWTVTGAGEVQMLGEGLSEGSAWNQCFRVGRAISLEHLSWGTEVGQLSGT